MSRSIAELRNTSEGELVRAHDRLAKNTVVGVNYYLEELGRRESAAESDDDQIDLCHRRHDPGHHHLHRC